MVRACFDPVTDRKQIGSIQYTYRAIVPPNPGSAQLTFKLTGRGLSLWRLCGVVWPRPPSLKSSALSAGVPLGDRAQPAEPATSRNRVLVLAEFDGPLSQWLPNS